MDTKKNTRKRKWQAVAIEEPAFFASDMEGFVSLEELKEYHLEATGNKSTGKLISIQEKKPKVARMEKTLKNVKKKKKKRKRKRKQGTNVESLQTDSKQTEEESQNVKKKKKKRKRKRKQGTNVEPLQTDNKQTEEESQNVKKKKNKRKRKQGTDVEPLQTDNKQTEEESPGDQDSRTGKSEIKQNDTKAGMSAWDGIGVPPSVLRALKDQEFTCPTTIQGLAIPPAIHHHRDIIGAAETGSGKTLAFGIPILHRILSDQQRLKDNKQGPGELESEVDESTTRETETEADLVEGSETGIKRNRTPNTKSLLALIMTPTRELAIQIKAHLQLAAKYTSIKIAAIVGGMAPQKQKRLLGQHPEIIVATPGRLWELITEGEQHLHDLSKLKCLVFDEADRMVEEGHFEELTSVLALVHSQTRNLERNASVEGDTTRNRKRTKTNLQIFMFSATLTLPKSFKKKGKEKKLTREQMLASLMEKIGMEKKKCQIVDATNKRGMVETLTETKITCATEEKDCYLYYFLLKYPGRTLVFANSIDCIRRLTSILRLLQINPLPLHAKMQQRQRLKNLDRFKTCPTGVLLATDVASRGLDIPLIQHVFHYQMPRNKEVYIHRSGRTARATEEGLSVVLIGPDDVKNYRNITKQLNKDKDLESFPVDSTYIEPLKKRISLARQIDKEEHKLKRKKSLNDWLVNHAKAMNVDIDEEILEDLGDTREKKVQQDKLHKLKMSLQSLIQTPLVPAGFSGKYVTQSGKLLTLSTESRSPTEGSEKAALEAVRGKQHKKKRLKR